MAKPKLAKEMKANPGFAEYLKKAGIVGRVVKKAAKKSKK